MASENGGLAARIKEATAPFPDEERVDSAIPPQVKKVAALTTYQGGSFWVEASKGRIERFRCSTCHTGKEKVVTIADADTMAHGDILIVHGEKNRRLTCIRCHHQDERDFLVTEEGKKVDFDHSYEVCGYCHFRQKKDWIGGAHGKRVANWAGKRVVKNCTFCHNPHSPRFAKRWPKTYSLPLSK